jgi:hypothetical protein
MRPTVPSTSVAPTAFCTSCLFGPLVPPLIHRREVGHTDSQCLQLLAKCRSLAEVSSTLLKTHPFGGDTNGNAGISERDATGNIGPQHLHPSTFADWRRPEPYRLRENTERASRRHICYLRA